LDLCAAPGGWLQVAQKYMPMQSTIVGIDLASIKPIRGCTTLVEDITTPSCRAAIKRVTPDGLKYDCVLHDGAPNVGGNYAKEAYSQAALTLDALKLATEFLTLDGWFVTKVFRSQEYHALLYAFQQLFKKVESTKPVASRDSSAEIFVVCKGYLAPTKIDPRLLKAEYLFANVEDGGQGNKGGQQNRDVLKVEKAKRNRSGYEDGLHSLYKETYAENFITNEKPAEMLGMYHCFILDGGKGKKGTNVVPPKDGFMDLDACEETNEEIRTLFRDLGVLNKSDFKMLLKWRLQVRKRLGMEDKKVKPRTTTNANEDEEDENNENKAAVPEDENERLLSEMEELQGNMDAEARRKKKKQAKMKQKDRIRAQLGLKGDGEAIVAEEDLFSLVRLKTKVR
jgi:AdoMet-dependent rRNA methyltransferase SPB1